MNRIVSQKDTELQRIKDIIIDKLISNMVYVEGGTFKMGSMSDKPGDSFFNESPIHMVKISSFYICRYQVTQEEWEVIMGNNPSRFKGAKCPVELVSWEDCQIFIKRLNEITGKDFRLPTEAEWEFVAKGGNFSRGYKYAGSNDINIVAWYKGNSGGQSHPVGKKAPNELGLYDMSGNVWEWCSDWGGEYGLSCPNNPKGSLSGLHRINRGGSWRYDAEFCRITLRGNHDPSIRNCNLGLRLAL